jgi:hypothetical protein
MIKQQEQLKNAPELSARVNELLQLEAQYSAGGIFPLPSFIASGQGSILKVSAFQVSSRLQCELLG